MDLEEEITKNSPQRGKVLALDQMQDPYHGLLFIYHYSSMSSSKPRTLASTLPRPEGHLWDTHFAKQAL